MQIEHIVYKDLNNILNNQTETEGKPMKSRTRKVLLPLLAFALLFSVGCDYASVTAPEPIEAQSTFEASPANDIDSENDSFAKKGRKKGSSTDEGKSSVGGNNRESTRYGWGF